AVEDKLSALITDKQKELLKPPPGVRGPPPGAPVAVQILPAMLRQPLKLTDDQKKQLETLGKDTRAKLDGVLTAEQKKEMEKTLGGFVNAWQGGAGGGGPPPSLGSAVFRSYRYPVNYPGLLGKDLTPGKTIEELQAKPPEKKN